MIKLQDAEYLVVHDNIFHADDVLCATMARILNPDIQFIRTRNLENLPESCFIADVGLGKYDHHQKGAPVRECGIPYSACGLIWQDYGYDVIKAILDGIDTHYMECLTEVELQSLYRLVEKQIITSTDAQDNGITFLEKAPTFITGNTGEEIQCTTMSFQKLISLFNNVIDLQTFPTVVEGQNYAFNEAVAFTKDVLSIMVHGYFKNVKHMTVKMSSLVAEAYNTVANKAHYDNNIANYGKNISYDLTDYYSEKVIKKAIALVEKTYPNQVSFMNDPVSTDLLDVCRASFEYLVTIANPLLDGLNVVQQQYKYAVSPFTITDIFYCVPSKVEADQLLHRLEDIAVVHLAGLIKSQIEFGIIQDLVDEAKQQGKRYILIKNGGIAWKKALYKIDKEQEILYVVFPKNANKDEYRVQAVPVEPTSFELLLPFPEEWRSHQSELADIIDVPSALFCHKNGFLASAGTLEGALEMVYLSLEQLSIKGFND